MVGQVQARGGGLAIAAAGELAEELTETGIGKAVGWYATRRTAVAVGRLIIWTRRYSFLAEAGFSGRFKSLSSKGVAVGGDAVQEWVGTVTASEMDEILAAGGEDILETYFRETGTEILGDTALKQFLRSTMGEFVTGTLADAAIETVLLPFQGYWSNPYLTVEQKGWQTVFTYGNVVFTAGITLLLPTSLLIRIPIAVGTNLLLKWVEPRVFPGAYAEHRRLRPLQ